MSNVSAAQSEFDFWEFVACARCQLPFTSSSGPTVPFWLTECGHVICNSHLNTDQSCAQCGAQGIQLIPLQREMDAPMSEWFRSVPHALDGVAYAAKFQQETMASQIRYYRSKHQQHKVFFVRLKREATELKKANEALASENAQLRQRLGYHQDPGGQDQEPSNIINSNGKRQMLESHQYDSGIPRTMSSPRSIITPLGPNRLTLPPGQQPPNLSSDRHDLPVQGSSNSQSRTHGIAQQQRPGSSRFVEEYAYVPPSTPQYHPQQLLHTQAAPRLFQRTKPDQERQLGPSQSQQRAMLPPPPPLGLNPTQGQGQMMPIYKGNASLARSMHGRNQAQPAHDTRQRDMGPPPPPQRSHQRQQHQSTSFTNAPALQSNSSANNNLPPLSLSRRPTPHCPPSNQFTSSNPQQGQDFAPPTRAAAPQRFVPAGGLGRAPTSGPGSTPRAPSRATISNRLPGGQRTPFVPGAGFG